MEPIHVHHDDSLFCLDDDVVQLSNGETMTKANKLIGYILAEYIESMVMMLNLLDQTVSIAMPSMP